MTEGIIQKVFKKYKPLRKGNGNYPYFTPRMWSELQQEIIEKIQELNDYEFDEDNPEYYHRVISSKNIQISELKKLIGDTK